MKKTFIISLCLLFASFGIAGAVSLSFNTSAINVPVSSNFSVDLMVSGLGNSSAPSLGAFDVDILYNPLQMTFLSYTLGTSLGDISLLEADDWSQGALGGGRIDLAEVSYLTVAELDALQADSFILANLTFRCLAPGTSLIQIDASDSFLTLGDANGDGLNFTLGQAVAVTQEGGGPPPIPEPSTFLLLGSGLAGLAWFRRRR